MLIGIFLLKFLHNYRLEIFLGTSLWRFLQKCYVGIPSRNPICQLYQNWFCGCLQEFLVGNRTQTPSRDSSRTSIWACFQEFLLNFSPRTTSVEYPIRMLEFPLEFLLQIPTELLSGDFLSERSTFLRI